MKKGLLLSVVASTMIFAGGDIAPVEPAAPAPAADCSDFYGQVGAYFQSADNDIAPNATDLFEAVNNRFDLVTTIGVEKQLFAGIGFGAEASAWTGVSSQIAANHRVANAGAIAAGAYDGGALTQVYLTGSFGNTAIKAGRFALPGSLSPILRTGTVAGVKTVTFDGVLVANTDVADTTIYGAWVYGAFVTGNQATVKIGPAGDEKGAFALGIQNKSLANTTITAVGYYGVDYFNPTAALGNEASVGINDAIAGAINVNTAVAGYNLDAQFTYVTGRQTVAGTDDTATMTAGAKLSTTYGDLDIAAYGTFENDGTNPVNLGGGNGALIGDNLDYAFGLEGYGVGAEIGYKVWKGRAYAKAAYNKYEVNAVLNPLTIDSVTFATAGYTFKVAGVDMKAEYRYGLVKNATAGVVDIKGSRVRLEAAYKF